MGQVMVNRTMAAKALKLKKQRRAWAAPLSVKSGIRPNVDVIKGYKDRAKGLKFDEKEIDELIFRLFKRQPFKNTPPGRREAMVRRDKIRMLAEMSEQVPDHLFFNYINNSVVRFDIFFTADKTCYVIVKENRKTRTISRSISYGSCERAISVIQRDKVRWSESFTLPYLPDD